MINPNELRYGNLVQYPFVGIRPIRSGADIDSVYEDGGMPIPLNADWLAKFGFKQDGRNWAYNGFRLLKYKDDLVYGVLNQVVNYTPIEHVHQLQNLYFATCLHELTIKETV